MRIENVKSATSVYTALGGIDDISIVYTTLYWTAFPGSRIDKQWFMIRDATLKTERLLTIVPLSGSAAYGCEVTTSDADATRNALVDLFTALQHP